MAWSRFSGPNCCCGGKFTCCPCTCYDNFYNPNGGGPGNVPDNLVVSVCGMSQWPTGQNPIGFIPGPHCTQVISSYSPGDIICFPTGVGQSCCTTSTKDFNGQRSTSGLWFAGCQGRLGDVFDLHSFANCNGNPNGTNAQVSWCSTGYQNGDDISSLFGKASCFGTYCTCSLDSCAPTGNQTCMSFPYCVTKVTVKWEDLVSLFNTSSQETDIPLITYNLHECPTIHPEQECTGYGPCPINSGQTFIKPCTTYIIGGFQPQNFCAGQTTYYLEGTYRHDNILNRYYAASICRPSGGFDTSPFDIYAYFNNASVGGGGRWFLTYPTTDPQNCWNSTLRVPQCVTQKINLCASNEIDLKVNNLGEGPWCEPVDAINVINGVGTHCFYPGGCCEDIQIPVKFPTTALTINASVSYWLTCNGFQIFPIASSLCTFDLSTSLPLNYAATLCPPPVGGPQAFYGLPGDKTNTLSCPGCQLYCTDGIGCCLAGEFTNCYYRGQFFAPPDPKQWAATVFGGVSAINTATASFEVTCDCSDCFHGPFPFGPCGGGVVNITISFVPTIIDFCNGVFMWDVYDEGGKIGTANL